MSTQRFLFIDVQSYDEHTDSFSVGIPLIETVEDGHTGPDCVNDAFDIDDQTFDAALLSFLTGVSGEPHEFLGKRFKILGA